MILAGANAAEGLHSSAANGRRRDRVSDPCAFLIGPDQLRPCRAETSRIRGRQGYSPGQLYFLRLLKSALTCCTKCVVEALCFSSAVFKRSKFLLMRSQNAGLEDTDDRLRLRGRVYEKDWSDDAELCRAAPGEHDRRERQGVRHDQVEACRSSETVARLASLRVGATSRRRLGR